MSQRILIKNIKGLAGVTEPAVQKKSGREMADFATLQNAWLVLESGLIADFGIHEQSEPPQAENTETIDATGKFVLPSYIDSHTHLVFAASREEEFVMRIKGKTYEEIAEAGGGILNSARRLQALSEVELFQAAQLRLHEAILSGTGAIEIKSGYGLTVHDELKMLRVIAHLKAWAPIEVKATFLGAHAIPAEFRQNREGYIRLITDEMLPAIATEKLADYCDVFCDQGFYTVEETDRILKAAAKFGLKAKIHANELANSGGVQVAVRNNAISVDHLECTGPEEIECLRKSDTMPVALPNCSFFLGIPYAPLRQMIDAGLPVCLASDFNPGTAPNSRMSFTVSLACTQMKLTPEEAFNAATINGAYAMELGHSHGSIAKGKRANVIITEPIPSLAYIPYSFGTDRIDTVIAGGRILKRDH